MRSWWVLGVIVVVVLGGAVAFRMWASRWLHQQLVQDAQFALSTKQYEEADALLTRLRHMSPQSPQAVELTEQLQGEMLREAQAALDAGQLETAQSLAERVHQQAPHSKDALLLLGQLAVSQERLDAAIEHFRPLLDGEGKQALLALCGTGNIHLLRGHLSEAEDCFRRALGIDPDLTFAQSRLVVLLTVQGRMWEARRFRFESLKRGEATMEDLLFLAKPDALVLYSKLEEYREAAPDDPLPKLGQAVVALRQHHFSAAEELLREVIAQRPDLLEAHAQLGTLLHKTSRQGELVGWFRALPENAEEHPDIWVLKGVLAQHLRQQDAAVRCFWEALRRDPNQPVATFQLAMAVAKQGQPKLARQFEERFKRLSELDYAADKLLRVPSDEEAKQKAAELTETLGRIWESCGWYRVILERVSDPGDAQQHFERLRAQLKPDLPQVLPEQQLASLLDFSSYPLPKVEQTLPLASSSSDGSVLPSPTAVTFTDVTAESGIDFAYHNGDDLSTPGRRMFEFTGGGIGVIDFDGDRWPDIYLTQGCQWPPEAGQRLHLDKLYRNLGNGQFVDVTSQAGLGDDRFSQGVAVGDINNDGWPDIYLANVGENRLYLNNGDGTFREFGAEAGIGGSRWTASTMIADVNGDSWPDLFEVNYLEGEDIFGLLCDRAGRARICAPTEFEAQHDRLFLGQGDGTFADRSAESGILVPDGKGLGIVAADFDGSGQLSLFIANDTIANFFFVNQAERGAPPQFSELAVPLGVAYDRDGRAQACMGVAIDDLNQDHRLDFYVTNFVNEPNTLYQRKEGGYFEDATHEAGLREPTLEVLGFGTQTIDGELDGYRDLIVTNGHVDDFTHEGYAFQMPPQYFRNLGGRFVELQAGQLGEFFDRRVLGRGLARLDYNRDGKEDFIVSHLDAPVSLIANTTAPTGHYLAVELRGRQTERDAIGTTVTVRCGQQTLVRQLTGGDGYMATNQRQLIFGLGAHEQVDSMTVRWPTGQEQIFTELPADSHLLVREGDAQLY